MHKLATSAGARAFKVGGPKLLILALKKHAVHNAITNINNSLMQSKIILIGVTSSELLFFHYNYCD